MRFEEAYGGWQSGRLKQDEAARLLGVCEMTFRRHIDRYEDEGLDGLIDTVRHLMLSSPNRRSKTARHSCRSWVGAWVISCASNSNAQWARITVCILRV